jgi:PAS domain S-box-containing protein
MTRPKGSRRSDWLFERSAEAIFVVGVSGRLLFANPSWEALTGCALAQVAGWEVRPTERSQPNRLADILSVFDPPAEVWNGQPAWSQIAFASEGGDLVRRRVDYWPHRGSKGRLLFILGLVREIEEAAAVEEATSSRLRTELFAIRDELSRGRGLDGLIGLGATHRKLVHQIRAAASTRLNTVVLGPPGSGKRTVTEAIHRSASTGELLQTIDCRALPPDQLMQQLELGLGSAGTLSLVDFLGMPRDVQAALSSSLANLNDTRVQVVATTDRDPKHAIASEALIPELYDLLSPIVIELRQLIARREDLPLLAQHFLEDANRAGGAIRRGFEARVIPVLLAYDWPGNLGELRRVIQSAHAAANGQLIGVEDLPAEIRGELGSAFPPPAIPAESLDLKVALESLERRLIGKALRSTKQNKTKAAELLRISRARLIRRIQELGIDSE